MSKYRRDEYYEAPTDLPLVVTREDREDAVAKDHTDCQLARCYRRTHPGMRVDVSVDRLLGEQPGGWWFRWKLPFNTKALLEEFDTQGSRKLDEGVIEITLLAPKGAHTVQAKNTSRRKAEVRAAKGEISPAASARSKKAAATRRRRRLEGVR